MFENLNHRGRKSAVSITIDTELLEKLKEIKLERKIESLSPMINEVLWEWFKSLTPEQLKEGEKKRQNVKK